ncbi:MAG TPA: aldose 1-epimerase [Bryobacteraceae bacterium]|nr:aldose 1-epimerase [Bryobacteraceae bacterium]
MNAGEYSLTAGELQASFLPGRGMLGVSLRYRGEELLRRLENLDEAAAKGSTAGIPLLYPWANRLSDAHYRVAGRDVSFDPASPLLHRDDHGLPIHGVKWGLLPWTVMTAQADQLIARLDWAKQDLLTVFPFRHTVEMNATLRPNDLTIATTVRAVDAVPVSFGFHPYFGIAGVPRSAWKLELPAMRRIVLDSRGIPTGEEAPFDHFDGLLGDSIFDAGFRVLDDRPQFALSGGARRITVEFLENFPYAQVFAPKGKDFVALEPMTARTNALVSGQALRLVEPGQQLTAAFRVRVE